MSLTKGRVEIVWSKKVKRSRENRSTIHCITAIMRMKRSGGIVVLDKGRRRNIADTRMTICKELMFF